MDYRLGGCNELAEHTTDDVARAVSGRDVDAANASDRESGECGYAGISHARCGFSRRVATSDRRNGYGLDEPVRGAGARIDRPAGRKQRERGPGSDAAGRSATAIQ